MSLLRSAVRFPAEAKGPSPCSPGRCKAAASRSEVESGAGVTLFDISTLHDAEDSGLGLR